MIKGIRRQNTLQTHHTRKISESKQKEKKQEVLGRINSPTFPT
jgi:hypothetical protein